MSAEPLPCPWCGRKPRITRTTSTRYQKTPWQVACPSSRRSECPVSPFSYLRATRERAVEEWNRRGRPDTREEVKP